MRGDHTDGDEKPGVFFIVEVLGVMVAVGAISWPHMHPVFAIIIGFGAGSSLVALYYYAFRMVLSISAVLWGVAAFFIMQILVSEDPTKMFDDVSWSHENLVWACAAALFIGLARFAFGVVKDKSYIEREEARARLRRRD